MNSINVPAVSRRDALKWAGAAAAAGALSLSSQPAIAQDKSAAAASLQGAGFYKTQVGDVELIVVSDGSFTFDLPETVFGSNVGKEAVRKALTDQFIVPENVLAHVNALVIRTGKDVILVDTGCGQNFGPTAGKLLPHLANAGIKPTDVTALLLTHAHADHLGGLMGENVFTNAEKLVAQSEFDFWTGDNPNFDKSGVPVDGRAGFVRMSQGVFKSGTWTKIDGEKEVRPKVRVVPAPGHTPGHLTVLIDGGGTNQLYYIADAAHHHAINLAHPEYYVAFDTDRDQAAETRKKIYDRAASEKLLVAGAHLPFPAVGHIRKAGEGFDWVPSVWKW